MLRSNCSNKGKIRRGNGDGGPEDDGDYATLRELPLITSLDPADDSTSEENKVLLPFTNHRSSIHDDKSFRSIIKYFIFILQLLSRPSFSFSLSVQRLI